MVGSTHQEAVDHGCTLAGNAGERSKAAVIEWRQLTGESVGFIEIYKMAENRRIGSRRICGVISCRSIVSMSISLIGSPEEIVETIFEYRRIGVTQFLFQARPDLPTLESFGNTILPMTREREAAEPLAIAGDLLGEGRP
jgi:alkanesulfonate monooxygenase